MASVSPFFDEREVRRLIGNITDAYRLKVWAAGLANEGMARAVLARSQQLVPVRTGQLMGSARVDTIVEGLPGRTNPVGRERRTGRFAAGEYGARVTYGNLTNVRYAMFVHERNLNYRHGQWKYLETAMREIGPRYVRGIAEAMRREPRAGKGRVRWGTRNVPMQWLSGRF